MSLQKRFLKSRNACQVTFCLPKEAAANANEVKLIGDFNNWESNNGFPMKVKKGEFTATIEVEAGREYQFRYLIDNNTWENDWDADKYVPNPYGVENSVVVAIDKQ